MLSIFGAMFQNSRLFWCGAYIIFELVTELHDACMTWHERRQPVQLYLLKSFFHSENQSNIGTMKEKERELPDWLREAEEKETESKMEKMPNRSTWAISMNYACHYGVKVIILLMWWMTLAQDSITTK